MPKMNSQPAHVIQGQQRQRVVHMIRSRRLIGSLEIAVICKVLFQRVRAESPQAHTRQPQQRPCNGEESIHNAAYYNVPALRM